MQRGYDHAFKRFLEAGAVSVHGNGKRKIAFSDNAADRSYTLSFGIVTRLFGEIADSDALRLIVENSLVADSHARKLAVITAVHIGNIGDDSLGILTLCGVISAYRVEEREKLLGFRIFRGIDGIRAVAVEGFYVLKLSLECRQNDLLLY